MPHICSTCCHAEIEQIDRALLANEPLRRIGARFDLAPSSLYRHKRNHLGRGSDEGSPSETLAYRVEKLEQRVTKVHTALEKLLVILMEQRRV